MRIARDSRQDSLVFRLTTWASHLEVRPCGQAESWAADSSRYRGVLWAIQPDTDWNAENLREIRYGFTPDGFETVVPARPLVAGCYWAAINAFPGHVAFNVETGGAVRELKWADTLAGLPPSR
jgi:hypothetical protein